MPSKQRIDEMYRKLLAAALDQPKPTPELKTAINALLDANTHSLRAQYDQAAVYNSEYELSAEDKPVELDQ